MNSENLPLERVGQLEELHYYLGMCYQYGYCVEQDWNLAADYYFKAANQGHAAAQYSLGLCYDQGHCCRHDLSNSVVQNLRLAVSWFRKAAAQGYAAAKCQMGRCYEHGRGVERDDKQAVLWYRRAAAQGYADAQYSLGICYQNGAGVDRDVNVAAEWFRAAAEQGYTGAQVTLTKHYETEEGVEKDKKFLDPSKSKAKKLPYHMIPSEWIEALARVAQQSVEKGYEPFNWRRSDSPTKLDSYLYAAADRHIKKWHGGESFNFEYKQNGEPCPTVTHHAVQAAYNLLMLYTLEICDKRNDLDDRFIGKSVECLDELDKDSQSCRDLTAAEVRQLAQRLGYRAGPRSRVSSSNYLCGDWYES